MAGFFFDRHIPGANKEPAAPVPAPYYSTLHLNGAVPVRSTPLDSDSLPFSFAIFTLVSRVDSDTYR